MLKANSQSVTPKIIGYILPLCVCSKEHTVHKDKQIIEGKAGIKMQSKTQYLCFAFLRQGINNKTTHAWRKTSQNHV